MADRENLLNAHVSQKVTGTHFGPIKMQPLTTEAGQGQSLISLCCMIHVYVHRVCFTKNINKLSLKLILSFCYMTIPDDIVFRPPTRRRNNDFLHFNFLFRTEDKVKRGHTLCSICSCYEMVHTF